MHSLPTMMPAKDEVEPLPASYLTNLITGHGLNKSQQAARESIRVMAVKFIMLHGPILGACVLLIIAASIMK